MNKGLVPRGTQKEKPRREVVGKTFNPAEMESAHSRKMTKGKVAKKVEFEKIRCRSLEGKEIRSQFSRDIPERKVNKKLLRKMHQKKKTMRK